MEKTIQEATAKWVDEEYNKTTEVVMTNAQKELKEIVMNTGWDSKLRKAMAIVAGLPSDTFSGQATYIKFQPFVAVVPTITTNGYTENTVYVRFPNAYNTRLTASNHKVGSGYQVQRNNLRPATKAEIKQFVKEFNEN